jgi:hypothetical protein
MPISEVFQGDLGVGGEFPLIRYKKFGIFEHSEQLTLVKPV